MVGVPTALFPAPSAGNQSFVQRLLRATITLNPNPPNNQPTTFAGSGSQGNTASLTGYRMSARITNANSPSGATARLAVYGLSLNLMIQLSTMGLIQNQLQLNTILIEAGDAINGYHPVFEGTIMQAYGDFNSAPDVPFFFECQTGQINNIIPALPTSFVGGVSVVTLMETFASALSVPLENNNVTGNLANPYYAGALWDQLQSAAADAGIVAELVDGASKLAIYPIGGARTSQPIIPVNAQNGMIGYPTYTLGAIIVKMIYNPQVQFGSQIQVQSSLGASVNKTWTIYQYDLALDSLVPNGQWMATAHCYQLGQQPPPVTS
jgi:hypothetical protein